jgi:ATP-binding cassette, subfamily B, bacterial MsbA
MQVYRRLLRYVAPHWRAFAVATVALFFVAATETAFAALIKPMMDGSFVDRDPDVIRWTPLALIAIFMVRGVATFISAYWMAWVARQVIKVLRSEMFARLLQLPVATFDVTPAGSLISRLIYDVEQVALAATDVITIVVRDTLTVIGLLAWMLWINWILALVLLIGTPLIAAIITAISRQFRRYSSRIQRSIGGVSQIAEETIEGQRVVKIFGGQTYERERFEAVNEENRRLHMRMEATSAASVPLVQLIAALGAAGVIYIATRPEVLESLTVGSFVSFIAAMMMLLAPMKRLTRVTVNLQRGIAAADAIFTFLDSPAEQDRGETPLLRAQGDIAFRQVTFGYRSDGPVVVKGINLEIRAGETVALVGRSGSGKSTLVNLLPRFYELTHGTITLDGVAIADLPLAQLRQQIALVTQQITLFNDTIANNIAYGTLRDSSRSAIEAAARAAHAWEFISQLPQGLDTHVGENGLLLSGGQRQRLAIARALLKDAPILILDEATSALDSESERHIQAGLERLMQQRTTLVIAHRLSTIERADKIVVLDHGEIREMGNHQQLIAQGGLYAALHRLQFAPGHDA